MADRITHLLGDTPGRTVVKLIVVSFLVGVVMTAMNWSPLDILNAIRDFVVGIWKMGFAALGRFGEYLAVGAMVVLPAFVILRLLAARKT